MEHTDRQQPDVQNRPKQGAWQPPAIDWEENYEPVVLAVSCASQPLNCGGGARL